MNLKNAKKIVSAYKIACSDGVPPTTNYDWQPSPMGYKMADLMLACRVVGTSIEELQKESFPKKEEAKEEPKKVVKAEPKKAEPKKVAKAEPKKVVKTEPKKAVVKEEPKKEEPKKVDLKEVISFGDKDKDGIPDYKDEDSKPKKSNRRRRSSQNKDSGK